MLLQSMQLKGAFFTLIIGGFAMQCVARRVQVSSQQRSNVIASTGELIGDLDFIGDMLQCGAEPPTFDETTAPLGLGEDEESTEQLLEEIPICSDPKPEGTLSDHNSLLLKVTDPGSSCSGSECRVLIWNVMNQWGLEPKYFTDGWGPSRAESWSEANWGAANWSTHTGERDEDYLKRLDGIASTVLDLMVREDVDVAALQEDAKEKSDHCGKLAELLESKIAALKVSEAGKLAPEKFIMKVIHNKDEEAEFVTIVRGDETADRLDVLTDHPIDLERQGWSKYKNQKFQTVYSEALNIIIVNVHLSFDGKESQAEETNRDFVKLINHIRSARYPKHQSAAIYIVGDFNRIPENQWYLDTFALHIEHLYHHLSKTFTGVSLVKPKGPTNVVPKLTQLKHMGCPKSESAFAKYNAALLPMLDKKFDCSVLWTYADFGILIAPSNLPEGSDQSISVSEVTNSAPLHPIEDSFDLALRDQ